MSKELQAKLFIFFLPLYYLYCMLIDVVFTRGSAVGAVINILLIFMFLCLLFYSTFNKKFWYIYFWIIFNILLIVCNSSNLMYSFKEFGKTIIGILCFPLSFYLISNKRNIALFLRSLIIIMILYMLNLVLANVLGWGQAYGGTDSEYSIEAGASIVTGSMPIVMALMMAPFISSIISRKILFVGIWSLTSICVLLIFKRTNIASLFIGYLLFIILYRIYQRKYNIQLYKTEVKRRVGIFFAFLFLVGLLLSIFGTLIYAQYEFRSYKFGEGAIEKEGRVIEWYLVKKAILDSDNTSVFLLGKEPYNTSGNYGIDTNRNIHGDFSMVLFSNGVIGSIFYWGLQLYIILLIIPYNKKRYLKSRTDVLLFAIYLSTSAIWFFFCFSATLRYVLLSSVYYMIHGMILRYFWNKHKAQNYWILLKKKYENSNLCKLQ